MTRAGGPDESANQRQAESGAVDSADPPGPVGPVEGRVAARVLLGGLRAGVVALPFLALLLLVEAEWAAVDEWDRSVADDLNAWARARPDVVRALDVVALATHPWVFRLAVVALALLLWRAGARWLATWAVVTMAVGGVLGVALKALVERARPSFPEPVATASYYSFPSGHALNSLLGVCVLLAVILPVLRAGGRAVAVTSGLVVVLLTGFDRIALGVHYVTDVVGGWLVALSVLVCTTAAFGAVTTRDLRWRSGTGPRTVVRVPGAAASDSPEASQPEPKEPRSAT